MSIKLTRTEVKAEVQNQAELLQLADGVKSLELKLHRDKRKARLKIAEFLHKAHHMLSKPGCASEFPTWFDSQRFEMDYKTARRHIKVWQKFGEAPSLHPHFVWSAMVNLSYASEAAFTKAKELAVSLQTGELIRLSTVDEIIADCNREYEERVKTLQDQEAAELRANAPETPVEDEIENEPIPVAQPEDCWTVLGLDDSCSLDDIETAYRSKAKTAHPDAGGDAADFNQLQEAYEEAKKSKTPADSPLPVSEKENRLEHCTRSFKLSNIACMVTIRGEHKPNELAAFLSLAAQEIEETVVSALRNEVDGLQNAPIRQRLDG